MALSRLYVTYVNSRLAGPRKFSHALGAKMDGIHTIRNNRVGWGGKGYFVRKVGSVRLPTHFTLWQGAGKILAWG